MKRLSRWLIVVAVFALIAAACGDSSDDTTATTTAATVTDTAPPATEAPAAFVADSFSAPDCEYGGKVESIEATAANEVVFSFCGPLPAFEAIVAFTPFGIQPSEHLAATGGAPLDNPIGTGPWALDNWARGDSITFTRFDDYWGDAAPYETLVFRWQAEGAAPLVEGHTIEKPETRATAIRIGKPARGEEARSRESERVRVQA